FLRALLDQRDAVVAGHDRGERAVRAPHLVVRVLQRRWDPVLLGVHQIGAPRLEHAGAGGGDVGPVADQPGAELGVAVALRAADPGVPLERGDFAAVVRFAVDGQRHAPLLADRAQWNVSGVPPADFARSRIAPENFVAG